MALTDEFSRGMVEEYYDLNIAEQLCRYVRMNVGTVCNVQYVYSKLSLSIC